MIEWYAFVDLEDCNDKVGLSFKEFTEILKVPP